MNDLIKELVIAHVLFLVAILAIWLGAVFVGWSWSIWPYVGEWDFYYRLMVAFLYIYVWLIPIIRRDV